MLFFLHTLRGLTEDVRVAGWVPVNAHGVGVVSGDYDERVLLAGHGQSHLHGLVHLHRLRQSLDALVAVVAVVDEAACRR